MDTAQRQTVFSTPKIVLGLLAIAYFIFRFLYKPKSKLDDFPRVGTVEQPHLHEALIEAHQKHPDTVFTIQEVSNYTPTVILPKRYIEDVKSLPGNKMSFMEGVFHRMAGKYTTLGDNADPLISAIKIDLTRNTGHVLSELEDEADFAIPSVFGQSEDWTPVQAYRAVARIVAILNARIFVGFPLCRNEEWIDITVNFTLDANAAIDPINNTSPLWRTWVAPFLQPVKLVNKHRARGANLLRPILQERLKAMQDPKFEPPLDLIQFITQYSGDKKADEQFQSHMQLISSIAALHTTAIAFTQVMYDLASHPEYIQPLREELESVLAEDGGHLVKASSLMKLKKMDSFMKESQRMNPGESLSLTRRVTSDVTLSDGLHLPKGTHTAFSNLGISYDPAIYPSPYEFQPWRFSDAREQPGKESKYQYVTTSEDSSAFGHGKYACPGRFFASNQIKIIFATILMRYDVKLKDGAGRPANVRGRTRIVPDMKAELLFRKRSS